jgi:hypothetical protein
VDHSALSLPRSVLLALWLDAAGAHPARAVQRTLDAVQGEDEPHRVAVGEPDAPGAAAVPGLGAAAPTLAELVAAWASGPRSVAAVLPVPGDPAGTPAAVAGLAHAAGEAVLVTTPDGSFAAVPEVTEFGSVYERGHQVTWRVHAVPDWQHALVGHLGSLADAEHDLTRALARATEALVALDVARWRPEAAARIAALRADTHHAWALPDGLDPRRVRVLTSAVRLRAIVALAASDEGGAVNLWQSDQRSSALRDVDHAARRALAVATHPGPAQPPSTPR